MNIQLKHLGFLGIYREAYKTIISAKKIFALITLTMILPLSVCTMFFLYRIHFLLYKIVDNCDALFPASCIAADKGIVDHLPSISSWIVYGIFNVYTYVHAISNLYLLSTTTVLYTMVCLYSGKDLNFTKLHNVVLSKFGKRLSNYGWMMLFHQFSVLLFLISMWLWTSAERCNVYVMLLRSTLLVIVVDVVGCAIYIPFWHLANVKSIFEDVSTTQAFATISGSNNRKLLFGHNIVDAIQHFVIITIGYFYMLVIMCDKSLSIACKMTWGIIYILLHSKMILLGLVVQNIVYFKTYHGEGIDNTCLADHENAEN